MLEITFVDALLLATKLKIPPQPQHEVPRGRLIGAVEQAVPHSKLLLLSAPAGYGKTTLLSQWAHTTDFPVAWLSISDGDNDIERFFRYLLTAWEEIQPGIKETPLGIMLGGMDPDIQVVLSAFINAGNDLPDHLVFILDDFHLIEDASIHEALTFLLDHLPLMLHFILACRGEPSLPLARYRARRELAELRAEDLRFLQEETADFLNGIMGLDLSDEQLVALQTQLEGWVAGLQLAALGLRRHLPGLQKIVVSGRQRFLADYLSEDVVDHLPEKLQRFLLQTSILERLCGSLCDAVTGGEDSQRMLRLLERENLFLVPLDDSRVWFRYHHLFAEFLREELKQRYPGEGVELHRRAAQWYLAHDLPDEALDQAVAGSDAETAERVFDKYTNAKLNTGELRTIKRWLDSVPQEWHTNQPQIGLAQAGLFAFSGAFGDCLRCVEQVERRLVPAQSKHERRQLAKVMAVRCALACVQNEIKQAESYANQALEDLTEEDDSSLHLVYGALGDAYRKTGRWDDARRCYLKVLELPYGPATRFHSVHAYGAMADLELRQGHLRDAAVYWHRALAGIEDQATWGTLPLPLTGWVFIRMAEVLYERNELAAAADHVSRGLERAELGGDVRAMIAGYLTAGRLKLAANDLAGVDEYVERIRPLMENAHFPDWTGQFERFQISSWLAQQKIRAVLDRASHILKEELTTGKPQGEGAMSTEETEGRSIAAASALILKGDVPSADRAYTMLAHLLQSAETEGRMGIVIEVLALQALALARRGDYATALTSLEHSLRLAEPEGYMRLFADFGLPMARLLQEARSRNVMPDYVEKLLAAFGGDIQRSAPTDKALPEPLSSREQEVLGLIAAGLTNKEIAERLIVSPETAKKHVANICAKLGVSNRTEATARARELNLLA
ncbi:MAG: LuxR C-terminal-related transcriptional regulator [Chloroflexota bacterium]